MNCQSTNRDGINTVNSADSPFSSVNDEDANGLNNSVDEQANDDGNHNNNIDGSPRKAIAITAYVFLFLLKLFFFLATMKLIRVS